MASVETDSSRPDLTARGQAAGPGQDAIGVADQIPRNTLALLMVAQVAVISPYLQQLSI